MTPCVDSFLGLRNLLYSVKYDSGWFLSISTLRNMTFKEPIPTFHYHSSIKIPPATAGRKGRKVCLTYKPIGIVWCVLGVWVSSKFSNNAKGNFRRVEEEPSWRSFDMPSSQGFKVNIWSRIAFRFSFLSRRGGEEKRNERSNMIKNALLSPQILIVLHAILEDAQKVTSH